MLDSVEAILVFRDLPLEMSLLWGLVFSGKLDLIRGFLPGVVGKSSWGHLCVCVVAPPRVTRETISGVGVSS